MQLGEYESKNQPFQIAVVDVNGELMTDWWIGFFEGPEKEALSEFLAALK